MRTVSAETDSEQPDMLGDNPNLPPRGAPPTAVSNGRELLIVPPEDLEKIDRISREMAREEGTDFDWSNPGDAVVAPSQSAIAVYENPRGEIVIRQEAPWPDDQDHLVIVNRANLQNLIDRLCDMAGIGSAG